jgi:hypothetical protein
MKAVKARKNAVANASQNSVERGEDALHLICQRNCCDLSPLLPRTVIVRALQSIACQVGSNQLAHAQSRDDRKPKHWLVIRAHYKTSSSWSRSPRIRFLGPLSRISPHGMSGSSCFHTHLIAYIPVFLRLRVTEWTKAFFLLLFSRRGDDDRTTLARVGDGREGHESGQTHRARERRAWR